MIKSIYIFSLLFAYFGANGQETSQSASDSEVLFDYTISSIDYEKSRFKIQASLTNPTSDTINLLTYSCHGLLSKITSDDSIVSQIYWWHCNGSVPEIYQLLPNSSKSIEADFEIKKYESEFKIGFLVQRFKDYYSIEELSDISLKKDLYYNYEDLIIESNTILGKPNRIKNK
jgi:hypothetical protein